MKKPINVSVLILLGLGLMARAQNNAPARPPEVSERIKRDQATIVELASRHGACTDWLETLPNRGFGKHYTVDLQRALVGPNNQPVAMEVWLQDVSQKDGVFTAHFSVFPLAQLAMQKKPRNAANLPEIQVFTVCTAEQAETLLKPLPEKQAAVGMRFACVARVDSVSRPNMAIVTPEEGTSGPIDFDSAPDVFYARGTCVELKYLEWTRK